MLKHGSADAEAPRKRSRKNTTRACDSCKAKKTRCDGVLPCSRCQTYNSRCSYDAPHSKSHPSPIVLSPPPSAIATAVSNVGHGAEVSREITPDATEGVLGLSSNLAFSYAARAEFTSRATSPADVRPDAHNSVAQGQEKRNSLGGTRAATVKHLHFSEPPFEPLNIARYSLPTVENGMEMSAWYFENASPTYRFLCRPDVERMVRHLCRTNEWLRTDQDYNALDVGSECTVLMCWALGCQYPVPPRGRTFTAKEVQWITKKGQTYYQVAALLINETKTGIDTLSILHVKLLMCLYLLTTARLKAAWDLFAGVKHITNSLDLTRPPMLTDSRGNTPLQATLRARVFWAVYTLDTYLCAMLGKMLTFGERDIKIKHTVLDDAEIMAGQKHNFEHSDSSPELSLMVGPAVHAKLARIVRQTLRDLYLDYNGQYNPSAVSSLAAEVRQWESELPEIFKLSTLGGLQPIFARQAAVIRLAMQHALILIYRPSLPLSSLTYEWNDPREVHEHQDACLQAAMVASEIVSGLTRKGNLSGAFWFSAYIAFCSGTVMLVYLGQNMKSLPRDRRREIWKAAQNCCETEKLLSPANRLARRYVTALETLSEQLHKRLLAAENQDHAETSAASRDGPSLRPGGEENYNLDLSQVFEPTYFLGNETSPSAATGEGIPLGDILTDLNGPTTFFDFDSFVSGGANFGW